MRKSPAPKVDSPNSLCRAAGHDWMTTAAANWRVCKRGNCHASERLIDGQWTSNATAYRKHIPVLTEGTRQRPLSQRVLWESQTQPERRP